MYTNISDDYAIFSNIEIHPNIFTRPAEKEFKCHLVAIPFIIVLASVIGPFYISTEMTFLSIIVRMY